ncbi:MAG TPA: DNA repair exonuclease, partial [Pirellulales bacterium]
RFLHAADLHLDRPCHTAADVPSHLLDLLIDAPLRAAAKVFDTVIDQHVDFVVLSGDVVEPHSATPRELLFLVEQLERLAQHNITVYWSGGAVDSVDHWPSYIHWPNNVHFFSRGHVQRHRPEIAGTPICEIIGSSHAESQLPRPYDFAPSSADLFSIAVAHANWNASALGEIGVDYWALGGPHTRSTPLETSCVAHFAGTPQGRSSTNSGPHGCTIVTVDEQSHVRLTPLTCDVLRWLTPQLSLSAPADADELERLLFERTEQLLADSMGPALLVTWQITCPGPLQSALRHGSLGAELTSKLRQNFGHRQQPLWTLAIEVELSDQIPPQWSAEETLRGDFLRAVQQCPEQFALGSDSAMPIVQQASSLVQSDSPSVQQLELNIAETLADGLSAIHLPPSSAQTLAQLSPAVESPEVRRRLLREVAWLGADLLGPAEASR